MTRRDARRFADAVHHRVAVVGAQRQLPIGAAHQIRRTQQAVRAALADSMDARTEPAGHCMGRPLSNRVLNGPVQMHRILTELAATLKRQRQ